VQGTASSVGKSTLAAGLCRLFARRGVQVAPFKAQNMSNNAAVCPSGGEIGRAQYVQAVAAGIEATVDMNPVLLKPQAGGCQVIVRGKLVGTVGVLPDDLWPVVVDALDRLRRDYQLIVAEGAGSPAEVNLRDHDIVNMRVARYAEADVILVADIDAGGAFASLLGTWEWLEPRERALVRGFVLNKFRGDAALLSPAPMLLEQRTGVPVLGVVPFIDNLGLAEEDAASLIRTGRGKDCIVQICVVQMPHLANFDEFGALAAEPGVQLTYVSTPAELRAPDLVILPGTKATIADLGWLASTGLADRVRWLAERGTPVLGICGGFQMLGRAVYDPFGVESAAVEAPGLGLLALETELGQDKHLERVNGTFTNDLPGIWAALGNVAADGYEIHVGTTRRLAPEGQPLLGIGARPDGLVTPNGAVAGTYVHGVFERAEPRRALLTALASARGFAWQPGAQRPDPYHRLADILETTVRLELPLLAAMS
jgi:adenosylcobyric acid synthase